eukprot:8254183-Alexandrium_andersonii.AAC.1
MSARSCAQALKHSTAPRVHARRGQYARSCHAPGGAPLRDTKRHELPGGEAQRAAPCRKQRQCKALLRDSVWCLIAGAVRARSLAC